MACGMWRPLDGKFMRTINFKILISEKINRMRGDVCSGANKIIIPPTVVLLARGRVGRGVGIGVGGYEGS